jgi:hypothetical protein
MIKILERSTEKVIGLHMSGKIVEKDIIDTTAFFDKALLKIAKVSWLCVITDYKGFTFKAFFKEFKYHILNFKHYKKKAIVTDILFFKIVTKTLGIILKIKYFTTSELEEAWKYIEKTDCKSPD